MNEINCEMCMDLMPLVQDGVASDSSRAAVQAHICTCPACRALYEGEAPAPSDGRELARRIQKKAQIFSAMVLMFCIYFGLSLTASSELFYNALIMPLIGILGYYLFRWRAVYTVPLLLLLTHFLLNPTGLLRGTQHLMLADLLLWTGIYALFALLGVVIAGLLHFVFRREPPKD